MKYVKYNFWQGLRFTDIVDLNQQFYIWQSDVANIREHGTTHRRPIDMLPEECLQPIDSILPYPYCIKVERKVSLDGYVDYNTSRYPVPWQYIGEKVTVIETAGGMLQVMKDNSIIAEHTIAVKPHSVVKDPGYHKNIPIETPTKVLGGRQILIPQDYPEVEQRPLTEYDLIYR